MRTIDPALAITLMEGWADVHEKAVASAQNMARTCQGKVNTPTQFKRVLDKLVLWMDHHKDFLEVADKTIRGQGEIIQALLEYLDAPANDGERWTDEETERAVDMRADGRSIEDIAITLDRSAQAVANRISQAVGIRQIEVRIKGLIDGDLSGEHTTGMFDGVLRKT